MRESDFIKQNIKKWFEFEQTLNSKNRDPDQLSKYFIEVTDDLSYARTFYPNRSVRVYLNGIAQKITQDLYKIKKPKWAKVKHFFAEDLPNVIYQSRKAMQFSLLVFTISVLIGVISSVYDPNFASSILGEGYVKMTEENIKNNDPMEVYKGQSQIRMMLMIGWNNIKIAFVAFVSGTLYGIGTLAIMLSNGIMLGTFQYFFYERGFFTESFLTIWLHGVPEIAAIIISGGCGFLLAQGLIFPGTFSRSLSFRIAAYRGLKIMVALVIVLVFAAFVESFITRYTEIPQWLRAIFILMELIVIVGYFVYWPVVKYRKSKKLFLADEHFEPPTILPLDFKNIKSNGEIFSMLFEFYKNNFTKIFQVIISLTLIYAGYLFYSMYDTKYESFAFGINHFFYSLSFIEEENKETLAIVTIITLSVLLYFTSIKLKIKEIKEVDNTKLGLGERVKYLIRYFWQTVIITTILYSIFLLPIAAAVFLFLLGCPFLLLWNYIIYREDKDIIVSMIRAFKLIAVQLGKIYGLFLVLTLLCTVFFLLLSSPILSMNIWAISLHVSLEQDTMNLLLKILLFFIVTLSFALIIPILSIGMSLVYYSLVEIYQADYLKKRINRIGTRKKYFGLARENN